MSGSEANERTAFGLRLKEAREYLELSQDEVARELGIPRTAISLMESGQRKVEALELQKLARLYEKPVGYFTGDATIEVPTRIQHLARTARSLSSKDQQELTRFAEYLKARSLAGKE